MKQVDEFLDKFQSKYFLNSLEKIERQELKDFIKEQNADLLEACEDAYAEINQLCFLLKDDLAKITLDKLQNAIHKAKGE